MTRNGARTLVGLVVVLAGSAAVVVGRQGASAPSAQPAVQGPIQPTTTLSPGLNPVPDYRKNVVQPPPAEIPEGFTSIFNGKDLTGWHISKTARHGVNPDFHVEHGMILGTQRPLGSGGLLITDKKYKNFEWYMEVKPDWGCDSGLFFRTTENGAAYQITLDYLPGGSMGQLIQEGGMTVSVTSIGAAPAAPRGGAARGGAAAGGAAAGGRGGAAAPAPLVTVASKGAPMPTEPPTNAGMRAWKREEWNTVRVRVTGDAPHATVWINGTQVSDAADSANHAVGGMIEGPIAIQIHGGGVRWQPGGFWRWRNIAVKELP